MRGTPPQWNLFIKYCVFILTCLTFCHLQTTLHLMQRAYRDSFSHCSKTFLNSLILMPFSALVVFCFTYSTLAKQLKTFFIQRNKKSRLGWDQVNREVGVWESCHVWSKTAEHSAWCGQVCLLMTHHDGQSVERVFKKTSVMPNTASHNNASWYTDTGGFLEHSPCGTGGPCTTRGSPSRR